MQKRNLDSETVFPKCLSESLTTRPESLRIGVQYRKVFSCRYVTLLVGRVGCFRCFSTQSHLFTGLLYLLFSVCTSERQNLYIFYLILFLVSRIYG